jgi:hypothetical protein
MRTIETDLIGSSSLNFAGWYTDTSFDTPFYKFTVIKESTSIYAGWGEPLFTIWPTGTPTVNNYVNCVLTNVTAGVPFESTSWKVVDAFKTSEPRAGTKPPSDTGPTVTSPSGDNPVWTVDLMPGLYEVTMTTTVTVGGEQVTKSITRTEKVEGSVSKTITWEDKNESKWYTITCTIDYMSEYIKLAEKNRAREFRISEIASFVVITPTIQKIADDIKAEVSLKFSGTYTQQQLMNAIMSFVNSNPWKSDSDYYYIKGFHKSHSEGYVEYYKYPIEAVYDTILYGSQGDCDCESILMAAIAKAAGFTEVAVITIVGPMNRPVSEREGHAVAGIKGPFEKVAFTGPFFLEPGQYGGYFAAEGNQGKWPLGYIGSKYGAPEYEKKVWPVAT